MVGVPYKKTKKAFLPALNVMLPDWFTGADVREIQGPVYIPPAGKAGSYRKELAADIARKAGGDPFTQRNIYSGVQAGADFIPLVGEDVGVHEVGEDIREGDYVPAAFGAAGTLLGTVPIIGDVGGKMLKDVGKKIKGYHGSPHSFEPEPDYPLGRFRDEKIGTGEGAQAYGHGHYIAENEAVARDYRDTLSKQHDLQWEGRPLATRKDYFGVIDQLEAEGDWRQAKVLDHFAKERGTTEDRLKFLRQYYYGQPEMEKAIDKVAEKAIAKPSGHMYEVDIAADPEAFLDWDKPLRDNPAMLQRFVDAHGGRDAVVAKAQEFGDLSSRVLEENSDEAKAAWEQMRKDPAVKLGEMLQQIDQPKKWTGYDPGQAVTGERLYRAIGHENLKQAGIPGIRYLDQGSRWAGDPVAKIEADLARARQNLAESSNKDYWQAEIDAHERNLEQARKPQSRNYVVFDPKIISIVKKYGLAGALAAGLISQDQAEALERQGMGGEAEAAPAPAPPRSPIAALDERVMDEAYTTRQSPRDVLKRLLGLQ